MNIERKIPLEKFEKETGEARQKLEQAYKSRTETFRDTNLDDENRIELTLEADMNRAKIIAENNKLFNEYSEKSTRGRSSQEYAALSEAVDQVKELLRSEHYELLPGMEYGDGNPKEGGEPRFRIVYEGGYAVDGKREMQFRVYEPTDQVTGHRWHATIVRADAESGDVKVVVIPEAVWEERPRTLLPASEDTLSLRTETAKALARWIRPVEHNPQEDTDKAVQPSGAFKTPPGTPIEILEERDSTLMARTRTIYPGQLSLIDSAVDSLIGNWDEDERAVLKEAGGGHIQLRVFAKYGGDNGEAYMELQKVLAENRQELQSQIQSAFESGAESVAIKCDGSWVERFYRNLPAGTSPRTHIRRMRAGVKLVLNKDDRSAETISLQRKINDSGISELGPKERHLLGQLLQSTDAELNNVISTGIIFKNGEFSPHPSSGPEAFYFYDERRKNRIAQDIEAAA